MASGAWVVVVTHSDHYQKFIWGPFANMNDAKEYADQVGGYWIQMQLPPEKITVHPDQSTIYDHINDIHDHIS